MNPEAQGIAIAEACGQADRWVLLKRGLYWRPNAHGYTNNLSEAWLLTEAKADEYVYPHDEPVTKKRAPLPNYLNDLNAMHEAEKLFVTPQDTGTYEFWLTDVVGVVSVPHASISTGGVFKIAHATAAQRAEAFLRTLGKWVED